MLALALGELLIRPYGTRRQGLQGSWDRSAQDTSIADAAKALGVTRAALSAFVNERAHLSPERTLRIEKAFGVSMDTLMRMQNSFDIAEPCKQEGEIEVASFVRAPPP